MLDAGTTGKIILTCFNQTKNNVIWVSLHISDQGKTILSKKKLCATGLYT